jgi:hypothetical protein
MTEPLRSPAITAVSSLLRVLPHLASASLLSSSSCQRLDFSLGIGVQDSPVPCTSLCHVPATSTPVAVWSVIRSPPDSSRRTEHSPVQTTSDFVTALHRSFTRVQLHGTHLTDVSAFSLCAQHHSFCLQHPKAVWNQYLHTDSGGPAPISCKACFGYVLTPFRCIRFVWTHVLLQKLCCPGLCHLNALRIQPM